MPRRRLSLHAGEPAGRELRDGFARIRRELKLPETFPSDVLAEAERAAAAPTLPTYDMTDLPFLTIDPPGSMDLDQAMHLERKGTGFTVRYAIADVAAFVRPGGAIDTEAHRRGETMYSPDTRTPLHPPTISEGPASLLADQICPALLWTIDLDADGQQTAVDVRRALVRSRDRLDYEGVQQVIDGGKADERLQLLAEVGKLRIALERDRGGVSLPIPEQEINDVDGSFRLEYRITRPVESWNEQISLMTGMAAAGLMLAGKIGVLRTLPSAPPEALDRLRRVARGLGIDWPQDTRYADVIRSLNPTKSSHAAFADAATSLLRGAGYTAFDGAPPEVSTHAAVAAAYAHTTAPLRRLVDRYVGEVCVALSAGAEVPDWARAALPDLPATMAASDKRAHELERECVSLMEAAVLQGRDGQVFDAVVLDVDDKRGGGRVQILDPAVRADCDGTLPLGEVVRVRLVEADVSKRSVLFTLESA